MQYVVFSLGRKVTEVNFCNILKLRTVEKYEVHVNSRFCSVLLLQSDYSIVLTLIKDSDTALVRGSFNRPWDTKKTRTP